MPRFKEPKVCDGNPKVHRRNQQDHGDAAAERELDKYKRDPHTDERYARYLDERQADFTDEDDLIGLADALLTASGDHDLVNLDGEYSGASEDYGFVAGLGDNRYVAAYLEQMDVEAALAGDPDAIERVLSRARERAAEQYHTLADLGLDPTPPLRRHEFLDERDPQEQHDRHDGLVGISIRSRP